MINWERTLRIPGSAKMSPEAHDLILKLCSAADVRLGRNGAQEVKDHPFFSSLDLDRIRQTEAPYKPVIRHDEDTSNFDPVDPDKLRPSTDSDDSSSSSSADGNGAGGGPRAGVPNRFGNNVGNHQPGHAFYEFTFRRFFDDGGHPYPLKSIAEAVAAAAAAASNATNGSDASSTSGSQANGDHQVNNNNNDVEAEMAPQTGSPVYV